MLSAAGIKVINLGVDVSKFDFINKAKEADADIIAMSALMTTTIPEQRDFVEELKRWVKEVQGSCRGELLARMGFKK